ncbi:hypothetical protein T11_6975, partial [Trichinella zimbabwensis]
LLGAVHRFQSGLLLFIRVYQINYVLAGNYMKFMYKMLFRLSDDFVLMSN